MILALGATLEEIDPQVLETEQRSAVFLTDSLHAKEAMELAGINFEGEVDLKAVEFCKIEAQ